MRRVVLMTGMFHKASASNGMQIEEKLVKHVPGFFSVRFLVITASHLTKCGAFDILL
jgi:hypothetical protein